MSISSQLAKSPPAPDDRTAAAVFTAHRVNDILTALAHAVDLMQVMRKKDGTELRDYHGQQFLDLMTQVLDEAGALKENMLAHYPAEAEQWRAITKVMNLSSQAVTLAAGYDLNQRSGMISFDLAPGTITPVPGGVTDHHITVVYLGPDVDDDAFAQACGRAQDAASAMPGPLAGSVGGIGSFKSSGGSDGKVPVWAGVVLPGAERVRSALEDLSASEHKDWKPHVTLAYVKPGEPFPAPVPHTAVTITHLSVHRGEKEVARFPLGGGPGESQSAVVLAQAVNASAKSASFAHLLQTIMYDGAHAEQHARAMLADHTDREWDFDADHAQKHMHGAREHTLKLAGHIRDNYPAEWRWLHELTLSEDLSNISSQMQMLDLGWQDQLRDPHGRWTTSGGLLARHVAPEGFSLDPRSGRAPARGFMVSLPGHTHQYPDSVMQDEHQLAAAIDHTLMSEKEIFKHPDVYLGGWVSDGKLWLDPSENINDRDLAVKMGRSRNQVAIWDVQGGQEIDTGGTGGDVIEHAAPHIREDPSELRGASGGRAQGRGFEPGEGIAGQAARIDLGRE